jgi:hypothetical protein
MQTFLPYPDFAQSAAALDSQRLGKQRVEAYQILKVLAGDSDGWKHHPAVQMWSSWPRSLVNYALACCDEWLRRNYKDTTREKILALQTEAFHVFGTSLDLQPSWLGDDRLHSSHRAALLWKAENNMTAVIVTRRDWANSKQGQAAANTLRHYRSLGWSETPRLNYWWPTKQETERARP